jgi:hypothetical protein
MSLRPATAVLLAACLLALPACDGDRDAPAQEGVVATAPATPPAEPRNPFGLEDVPDCCGAESQAFAEEAPELGAADDPNAEAWDSTIGGANGSIDGEWAGRWKVDIEGQGWFTGTATIRTIGDRVFVHYRDESEYLLEAMRQGDRLIGRYFNANNEKDRSPWVGRIVDGDRIDGAYIAGRWDFRRGGRTDGGSP